MRNLSSIIFDLDGVVVDSETLHEQAQFLIFEQYGLNVPPSALARFKGKTEEDVFYTIVEDYATEPLDVATLIEHKHRVFRDLHDQLQLVPGVRSFIKNAASRYVLALTTSAIRKDQERAFKKFGLEPFFNVVVTKEDIMMPKPDPEPYLVTVERLRIPASSCLVIEDSVNGIHSALAAGCRVAAITTSFEAHILLNAGAHIVFSRFDQLAGKLSL